MPQNQREGNQGWGKEELRRILRGVPNEPGTLPNESVWLENSPPYENEDPLLTQGDSFYSLTQGAPKNRDNFVLNVPWMRETRPSESGEAHAELYEKGDPLNLSLGPNNK